MDPALLIGALAPALLQGEHSRLWRSSSSSRRMSTVDVGSPDRFGIFNILFRDIHVLISVHKNIYIPYYIVNDVNYTFVLLTPDENLNFLNYILLFFSRLKLDVELILVFILGT